MTVKKHPLFLLVFLLPYFSVSQREYRVGDTLPNIRNYIGPDKKLVIFDLWNIRCSGCIESFPRLDALQQQFRDDVSIILANDELKPDMPTINKHVSKTSMKSIAGDSVLIMGFPHATVPHCVWVRGDGKIVGITGSSYVNAKYIQLFLDKKLDRLLAKEDRWRYYGHEHQLEVFKYRSMFSPRQPIIAGGFGSIADKDDNVTKIFMINKDIHHMIRFAYKNSPNTPNIDFPEDSLFCYELIIPPTPRKQAFRYMQEDLERYFGIKKPKN
jgi:hypothetical protein